MTNIDGGWGGMWKHTQGISRRGQLGGSHGGAEKSRTRRSVCVCRVSVAGADANPSEDLAVDDGDDGVTVE